MERRTRWTELTSQSSCAAHVMSVTVIEQTHVGSAVLVSSEDLGYDISRVTWGGQRHLQQPLAACSTEYLDMRQQDDYTYVNIVLHTRHVVLILALLRLRVGHDCAC
jgi:hypothetical protein